MATKIVKYPLDRTGTSKDNLVLAEPHLVPRDKSRVFATNYGPFFTASMVVRQRGGSKPLTVNVDYKVIQLYQEATLTLGISVSTAVIIINTALGSDFEIDYQVVGGPFSLSSDAIGDTIENLELDTRKVAWADILGKPVRFPPAPHLHDADDLYGMEYVYDALENLRTAILQGDVASHEQIYSYIDRVKSMIYVDIDKANARIDASNADIAKLRKDLTDLINGQIANMQKQITDHLADKNNPHGVTKAQVGLSNVQNYAMSTNGQAVDENNNTSYLSPSALWYALKQKVLPIINNHIADKNNPHGVTKGQVGLGDVPNNPMATQQEAEAGAINERMMSPLRSMQLINSKVMPTLNNHINNRSNPHGVTTGQIGAVPVGRRINGHDLNSDFNLTAGEVDAYTRGEIEARSGVYGSAPPGNASGYRNGYIWYQYV
ncbi:hypothetical protein pEaSNUABM54_00054 [Erwinia phage pEa_SNUABM_54]|nr:hypothetical protein pEaSNUABM54_00054 [Erwinia phage pEa_SNUABM_54]